MAEIEPTEVYSWRVLESRALFEPTETKLRRMSSLVTETFDRPLHDRNTLDDIFVGDNQRWC